MPEEGIELTESKLLLNRAEIQRLASLFVGQGVRKIRLTGGEPTVRKDLMEIIQDLNKLKAHGLETIGMTTNGIALKRKLKGLKESGLDQLNISLDTLDPFKFELMTRRRGQEAVLESVYQAVALGFAAVKMNVVVINKVNSNEILDFIALTKDLPIIVRFIEYMPFDGNRWNMDKFVSYQSMLEEIKNRFPHLERLEDDPNDTSKHYKVEGYLGKFGFITSMSDHFCGTCNRLRVLADGNMKVCLFGNSEVNLRDLMRNETSDEELLSVISAAGLPLDI
jgi:molybdenum cofactor biosynthesis protein A